MSLDRRRLRAQKKSTSAMKPRKVTPPIAPPTMAPTLAECDGEVDIEVELVGTEEEASDDDDDGV